MFFLVGVGEREREITLCLAVLLSAWAEREGQSMRLTKTGLPSDSCSLPGHVSKDYALLAWQFAQLLELSVISSVASGEDVENSSRQNKCLWHSVRKCYSWLNTPDLRGALISALIVCL